MITDVKRKNINVYMIICELEYYIHADDREGFKTTLNNRIIKHPTVAIDFVLYTKCFCYMPQIVKENIHRIITEEFVCNFLTSIVYVIKDTFPRGINLVEVFGYDAHGIPFWDHMSQRDSVKKVLNYIKLKYPAIEFKEVHNEKEFQL